MIIKIALGVFIWIILARAVINKDKLLGDENSREYVKDFMKTGCLTLSLIVFWILGLIGLILIIYGFYSENGTIKELGLFIGIPSGIILGILETYLEYKVKKIDKKEENEKTRTNQGKNRQRK